jgi:hypothetical protein
MSWRQEVALGLRYGIAVLVVLTVGLGLPFGIVAAVFALQVVLHGGGR